MRKPPVAHIWSRMRSRWRAIPGLALLGFALTALLLAVPYPRAETQVELLGTEPDFLTISGPPGSYRLVTGPPPETPSSGEDVWRVQGAVQGFRFTPEDEEVAITVVTTAVDYRASFRVRVDEQTGVGIPLYIFLQDSTFMDALAVRFCGEDRQVRVETRQGTDPWVVVERAGEYRVGESYDFVLDVASGGGGRLRLRIPRLGFDKVYTDIPVLRREVLNLGFGSVAKGGTTESEVAGLRVTLPDQAHGGFLTSKGFLLRVARPVIVAFLAVVAFAVAVLLARKRRGLYGRLHAARSAAPRFFRTHRYLLLLVGLVFPAQLLLALLEGHPYDFFEQKVWSYVITRYGLHALYPLSTLLPSGQGFGTGTSIVNMVYPYPPLAGYVLGTEGWLFRLVSPSFDISHSLLRFLIKVPWILALDAGAVLVYLYLRRSLLSRGRMREAAVVPLGLAAAYALSPGLNLGTAAWGQFEVVPALGYALAIVCALTKRPTLAWLTLFLAAMFKQAPIVEAPFIALIILYSNGPKSSLLSLGKALVGAALVLVPALWAGYTPRFLFTITVGQNVANIFSSEPPGVPEWARIVAYGTYNIWPLVTGFADGASGWGRYATPASTSFPGLGVSYLRLGTFVTAVVLACLLAVGLWKRKQTLTGQVAFLYVALALLTVYMFMVGVHERYFAYIFLPLLLSYPMWKNKTLYLSVLSCFTVLYMVSIYGTLVLTSLWYPGTNPRMSPSAHFLNRQALEGLTNDHIITIYSVVNLVAYALVFAHFVVLLLSRSTPGQGSDSRPRLHSSKPGTMN